MKLIIQYWYPVTGSDWSIKLNISSKEEAAETVRDFSFVLCYFIVKPKL